MQNPVMYIIANKGAGMSPGKLAAQVAHAAVKAYEMSRDDINRVVAQWNLTGHAKIVLEARDTEHLMTADRYIANCGYRAYMVIDEGRTEVPPLTPTALGVEIVDKADPDVRFAFSTFKTYRETPELLPIPLALDEPPMGWPA